MRIVFLGSPEFAVPSLEALHASSHKVLAVVTQPDRPSGRKLQPKPPAVKLAAEKFGLQVLQPVTTKTPEFLQQIAGLKPDALVVVAYGEILRRNLLELAPAGAINLHASLLPKYRGAAPIPWAILHGDAESGATTIQMNEGMDAGPILLQANCPIDPSDTSETLSQKIATLGAPLLTKTLDLWERNELKPVPQDLTRITYAPKLKKEDGWVDWNKPADWIARQIRAFDPWPGTFSSVRNKIIKFWSAHPDEKRVPEPPGAIVAIHRDGLEVACGEGSVLKLVSVQVENRPRTTGYDLANGYQLQRGELFVSNKNLESE
jgi:methionyl-tRNA formyltransferase